MVSNCEQYISTFGSRIFKGRPKKNCFLTRGRPVLAAAAIFDFQAKFWEIQKW